MNDARRLDRRSLFDVFRRGAKGDPRPAEANATGFSLASFYAGRAEAAPAPSPFPRFALREGLAPVETTSVGAGPLDPERKKSP
jgi:hypothetical protein